MIHKGMLVGDIRQRNQRVEGVFRVSAVGLQRKNNGESYWAFNINDASGGMPARRWPSGGVLSPAELPEGCFVHIIGVGSPYNDQMQVRVDEVRVLGEAEAAALDEANFLPPAPYDGEAALKELLELVERETRNSPWHAVVHAWFDSEESRRTFAYASAANRVHHSGRGGLAAHTLEVCRICAAVASLYPDVDRPTLICGALFHDIGKLMEMDTGVYETTYTSIGRLAGHIVLGVTMLMPVCVRAGVPQALREHFCHLILSHHGIVEHGAVKRPATREAFILAQADLISAKLNTMAAAEAELAAGAITPKDVFGVEGPVYRPVTVRQLREAEGAAQAAAGNEVMFRAEPRRAPAREAGTTAAAGAAPARWSRAQEAPRSGSLLDIKP